MACRSRAAAFCFVAVSLIAAACASDRPEDGALAHLGQIQAAYTYDPAGHLLAVGSQEGSVAYSYDDVGNIIGIGGSDGGSSSGQPDAPAPPAIEALSTDTAEVGQQITISGRGFESDSSLNAVVFGERVYAAVVEASETELVVVVPPVVESQTVAVSTVAGTAVADDEVTVTAPVDATAKKPPGLDDPDPTPPARTLPEGLDPTLLEQPILVDSGPVAGREPVLDGAVDFPVDLTDGSATIEHRDAYLNDVVPIVLARNLRQVVTLPGQEAQLTWLFDFDISLAVTDGTQYADLELPTGHVLEFTRTSEGASREDAVLEHTSTSTAFYGSSVTPLRTGWALTLVDGTQLEFTGGSYKLPLTSIVDRNGNRLLLERVADTPPTQLAPVSTLRSPSGRWIELAWNGDELASATDSLGRTTGYDYDGSGRLARVTYPDESAITYDYDSAGRLAALAGADGSELVAYTYDETGHVATQTTGDGSTWQFAYETDESESIVAAEVVDPIGQTRRITFDEKQRWISDTAAVGTPLQSSVTVERDSESGFISSATTSDGRRLDYGIDPHGYLTSTALEGAGAGGQVSYTNDTSSGLPLSIDSAGSTNQFVYDDAGNLVEVIDEFGHTTSYTYDEMGRPTTVTGPTAESLTIDYELDHRVTVTDPGGARWSRFFDAAGRPAADTDSSGNITRYRYDDLDRVTAVTDPAGGVTQFGYDVNGHVSSITDAAGNETSYTHGPTGLPATRRGPSGAVERYRYGPTGSMSSMTDARGVETRLRYDQLGRLDEVAFGARDDGDPESTVRYRYDDAGRMVGVDDSAYGTVEFSYDRLTRLVSETGPDGTVEYVYDDAGRRTAMAVDGVETRYEYDASGLLAGISRSEVSVSFTRDEGGRVVGAELPNEVEVSIAHNPRAGVDEISFAGTDGDLGSVQYGYDASGRRSHTFGEFGTTDIPSAVQSATYDESNALVSWAGADLVYDDAGNLVSDGTNTYSWNARGELVEVEGQVSATYSYDPFGRRVSKTVDGETLRYRYDGDNIVAEVAAGGETTHYLTGLGVDEIFARSSPDGATTTYLTDVTGNVVGLVGENSTLDTTYTYTPHGARTAHGASDPNPFGLGGRPLDETGLYQLRARYYHPEWGRFISPDPLGHAAGDVNLYAYVAGDPVNYIDPSGLQGFACIEPGLGLIDEAFDLADQAEIILGSTELNREQKAIASDNILRRVDTASQHFVLACAGEAILLPTVTGLIGPRITSFGRQIRALPPGPQPRAAIGPAGNPAARASNAPSRSGVGLINGRAPINSSYAGRVYNGAGWTDDLATRYPNGVRFNDSGFPDFSPYSRARAQFDDLTGVYVRDAAAANRAVGLSRTPAGHVWHHVEDGRTMILIPQDIHGAVRHTGGAAVIRGG